MSFFYTRTRVRRFSTVCVRSGSRILFYCFWFFFSALFQIDLARPSAMYATSSMYVTNSNTGVTMSHPAQLLTTFPPPPAVFANKPVNNLINNSLANDGMGNTIGIPITCYTDAPVSLFRSFLLDFSGAHTQVFLPVVSIARFEITESAFCKETNSQNQGIPAPSIIFSPPPKNKQIKFIN